MDVSRRILALWLPRLATDRLKRRWKAAGKSTNRPLIVAGKTGNTLLLTAVDEAAAKLRLYPGQALADARAMVPNLAVMRANAAADKKLLEAMADWCERYTPLVALNSFEGLFLDITGVAHLFGGEASMLNQVCDSIARQGFSVRAALAGTAEAARALAHYRHGVIVPPAGEAVAVAPLPVEALAADPLVIHALKRAGLKTIGAVAERTRHELAARFGGAFVDLLDRTLGKNGGAINPRRPLPDLTVEQCFAEPVVTEAAIASTLLSLGRTLGSVLEERGRGARLLEAAFFRADGAMRRIGISTGEATRDAAIFARLFRERLASLADPLDPGFGFDLIRLSAHVTQAMQAKLARLDEDVAAGEVGLLIDRLAARFGPHRVLRFQAQDTHIPEAAAVTVPAQEKYVSKLPWQPMRADQDPSRRPLRLFAKPEPIDVVAEAPDGPPVRFRWRRAQHSVAHAEGPERIAMEWWRHQDHMPTRDYFRVQDEKGRKFWLYRDGLYARESAHPRWYLHGLFA